MVAFRTKGVDFTSHFLGDETEFLTLSVSALHRADVIFQVVVQAVLFLVYIQFFDIIDHLLFEPVLVVVLSGNLFEIVHDTGFDFFDPLLFILFYF